MKLLILLLIISLNAFSQSNTTCSGIFIGPAPDYLIKGDETTYQMCIGRLAGASLTDQKYVIIIGDFKISSVKWTSDTIYYDRKFWYFKTKNGKELLKYLDQQTSCHIDGSGKWRSWRVIFIQQHIKKYYLNNIYLEFGK